MPSILYRSVGSRRIATFTSAAFSDRAKACEVGPHVSIAVVELGLVPYIKLLDFLA